MAFPATAVGGKEPTVRERLGRLEAQARELRIELLDTAARLRAEARDAASKAAERVRQGADDRFRAMERAILGDTPSDKRRRLFSIAARRGPHPRNDREHCAVRATDAPDATIDASRHSLHRDGPGPTGTVYPS